jgi:DNA topoisomerase-1
VVNTKNKPSHRALLRAERDARHAASMASLIYINSDSEGITREKRGRKFLYYEGTKQVRDKKQLERIRRLAIPPSWKNVWICKSFNGHIQATGTDLRGRKQYRYHANWNSLRNETKFHKLYEFGKTLPKLRKKIRSDMKSKDLSREKVLATAINLMDKTYIRIGNNGYEKMNGSYGLTTLKDKHVKFLNGSVFFTFTGKKGIDHSIRLKDRKLANIIKQCRDIPGKDLFQYYDAEGRQHPIDSGMVNAYIKEATSQEFSAKDFRTWAGSLQAVEYFRENPDLAQRNDKKKATVEMISAVSEKLGNTATVCKKYYIHPQLISLCEEGKITADLLKARKKGTESFTQSEDILMCILKKCI